MDDFSTFVTAWPGRDALVAVYAANLDLAEQLQTSQGVATQLCLERTTYVSSRMLGLTSSRTSTRREIGAATLAVGVCSHRAFAVRVPASCAVSNLCCRSSRQHDRYDLRPVSSAPCPSLCDMTHQSIVSTVRIASDPPAPGPR
eukprot:5769041-Pleurochrysis_carterae.AAC.3